MKPDTWVSSDVANVFRKLFEANKFRIVETYKKGELCGSLLGVDLHKIFLGETMYSLVPGASKGCIGFLMTYLKKREYRFMDVQVTHASNHPCNRIGEINMPIKEYLYFLDSTLQETTGLYCIK